VGRPMPRLDVGLPRTFPVPRYLEIVADDDPRRRDQFVVLAGSAQDGAGAPRHRELAVGDRPHVLQTQFAALHLLVDGTGIAGVLMPGVALEDDPVPDGRAIAGGAVALLQSALGVGTALVVRQRRPDAQVHQVAAMDAQGQLVHADAARLG